MEAKLGNLLSPVLDKFRQPNQAASSLPLKLTPSEIDKRDIPAAYRKWQLTDFSQSTQDAIAPFLAGAEPFVYLQGSTGAGKSCLAGAILMAWRMAKNDWRGGYPQFVTANTFRDATARLDTVEQKMKFWKDTPIVVLDEIGGLRSTPFVIEHLLRLVGHRYENAKATIATSNLSISEIATSTDARIGSRFQSGIVLDLGKRDRRIS
jgi:DNA replication protein DnaC